MRKNKLQSYRDEDYDASQMSLEYGSPQGHRAAQRAAQEDANIAYKMQRQEMKNAKKEGIDHLYKQDYQPANFNKAVNYRNSRSYMKKLPSGHYVNPF